MKHDGSKNLLIIQEGLGIQAGGGMYYLKLQTSLEVNQLSLTYSPTKSSSAELFTLPVEQA